MTDQEYLSLALSKMHSGQWFGWKKEDDNGNVIPNDQRMTYENIVLNDSTVTIPSKADVDAKIQELKDAETNNTNARTSAINKLKGATYSALTDAEAKALFGE